MTQKYHKGDVITVKATVVDGKLNDAFPDKIYVEPFGHHANIFVDFKSTELVHRFFQARDRVVLRRDDDITRAGIVIATFDDQCWVNFDNGGMSTVEANELEQEEKLHVVAA